MTELSLQIRFCSLGLSFYYYYKNAKEKCNLLTRIITTNSNINYVINNVLIFLRENASDYLMIEFNEMLLNDFSEYIS